MTYLRCACYISPLFNENFVPKIYYSPLLESKYGYFCLIYFSTFQVASLEE